MASHHILHIRDSSDIYGGERVILTLGKNMVRRGLFDVSLLCMRRPDGRSEALISSARKLGITVHPVDVNGRLDPAAILQIRSYIRNKKVSLIHTHDFKSDFYGIWSTLNLGVMRVTTAHGSTRDSLVKKLYLFFDEYLAYRSYDRIIAVSEELRDQLLKKRVAQDKIEVIQNGLDVDLLSLNQDVAEPPLPLMKRPGMRIFGVIGRLYPDKGQAAFLQAFAPIAAEDPGCFGVIVGDGPERENLAQLINALHLNGRVYLCGVRKNIKTIYDLIDYLVIPSFTEGLPYVLLEAMASRIPVLATAVGDIPLLIQDGVTGYLVPAGDHEAMILRMRDLLTQPEQGSSMARRGRDLVEERFSAHRMVEQTEQLYNSILS
ncbi:MAG: glycosyltransferase [Desulfomonilia bacterium]|nr:glycosyltransferase [Desulfomonilia bacterium]